MLVETVKKRADCPDPRFPRAPSSPRKAPFVILGCLGIHNLPELICSRVFGVVQSPYYEARLGILRGADCSPQEQIGKRILASNSHLVNFVIA